jgi:hypothetical protein
MRMATMVRTAMAAFGAVYAWWGIWARVWPAQFFADFPGLGRHWTAAYPPYNDHLVTDLGSSFLTLSFLLLAAAVVDNRAVRTLALLGTGVFGALHLSFHVAEQGEMPGGDYATSIVALALGVLIPVGLLVLDRTGRRDATPAE